MTIPISIKRSVLTAFQNLWRNKILSIATLAIITLIVFIFYIILTIHILTKSGIEELNKKVDIILYLKNEIEYLNVQQMIYEIQKYPETAQVIYTSKESALDSILQKYPNRSNPFEEYGIENPLPASITITTKDPSQHKTVLEKISESDFFSYFLSLENNNDNIQIAEKLTKITNFTKNLLITIIFSFAIGATMIIMNAMHLTFQNRKEELIIQQLVGAKLNSIKLPFIIEGVLYGLSAGILSSLLIFIVFKETNILEVQLSSFSLRFYDLIIWQIISCILVSVIGTYLAIHKYLKLSPL